MTSMRTARAGWHLATLKPSKHTRDFCGLAARLNGLIVILALWGLLSETIASWLSNLGGQRNV